MLDESLEPGREVAARSPSRVRVVLAAAAAAWLVLFATLVIFRLAVMRLIDHHPHDGNTNDGFESYWASWQAYQAWAERDGWYNGLHWILVGGIIASAIVALTVGRWLAHDNRRFISLL